MAQHVAALLPLAAGFELGQGGPIETLGQARQGQRLMQLLSAEASHLKGALLPSREGPLPRLQQAQIAGLLQPGITAWAAGQFLQLSQHPFSRHLGQR